MVKQITFSIPVAYIQLDFELDENVNPPTERRREPVWQVSYPLQDKDKQTQL